MGLVELCDEEDFHGRGKYTPRVIMVDSADEESITEPWRMRRVTDCQVRTWWEKEVRDAPWAAVEKTGCRRTPPRMKFMSDEVDGRKNERWDIKLEFKIEDSKLPGSMIGGGWGVSGIFSVTSVVVESAISRFWDRFKLLLKRRCSNSGVNGSNR